MAYGAFSFVGCLIAVVFSIKEILNTSCATHGEWSTCSSEEAFLTLWNINLNNCVYECQVRGFCASVSYNRTRAMCAMMSTVNRHLDLAQNESCVFVRKPDVSQLQGVLDACQNCSNNTVCDVDSGNCIIKECRKLQVDSATIKGNMLSVGAKAVVKCLEWYQLDRPNAQVVCQTNGSWGDTPSCVPLIACGVPPNVSNAEVGLINTTANTVVYVCSDGYSTVSNQSNDMTLGCKVDGAWTEVGFTCITCGHPPVVSNAEAVAVNATANGIDYVCADGHLMPDNHSDSTVVCRENGTWEAVGFECIRVCPVGWHQIGPSCYFTPGPSTTTIYFDAIDYCIAMDSYLLQLEAERESNVVKNYLLNTYGAANWWLGLSDLLVEGNWIWANTGIASTFYDWILPPDEGRWSNFAIIENTIGWEDVDRNGPGVPVCEKSADAPA